MRRGLCLLLTLACASAQPLTPEKLLTEVHTESQRQPVGDRVLLLYDLATAATAVDTALSANWSMELYDLAVNQMPRDDMNRGSMAKNALTVLSLTDPERAAQHFLELEPSTWHMPNEDPRIDCARNLFPRLWDKRGKQALPAIQRMAEFTARTGQYPYIGIGHILPRLAQVDRAAARSLYLAASWVASGITSRPREFRSMMGTCPRLRLTA